MYFHVQTPGSTLHNLGQIRILFFYDEWTFEDFKHHFIMTGEKLGFPNVEIL